MKKSLLSLVIASSMILSFGNVVAISTNATDANVESGNVSFVSADFEYVILDDGTVEIVRYVGNETEIVIPDTISGWNVSSIGYEAFANKSELESIVISEGITTIGEKSFWFCENLTDVKLPSTLKTIGYMSFWACRALSEITIPNGVTDIQDGAFGITNIKEFYIPASVTYCDFPFDFDRLNEVIVDEDNSHYYSKDGLLFRSENNELLLYPHGNKRTEYKIPEGTSGISDSAFLRGTGCLKELTIPGSIKTIKTATFWGGNLNKITICEGTEVIEKYAFVSCNFKNIVIPKSVTFIGEKSMGYSATDSDNPLAIEGFTIYGYVDTVAETYANDNGFDFVALDTVQIVSGDADANGVVNARDRMTLTRYLAKWSGYETIDTEASDVNGDGTVNAKDRMILTRYLAKWQGYEMLPYVEEE